jgi:uncharacterized protein (DUF1684 family)
MRVVAGWACSLAFVVLAACRAEPPPTFEADLESFRSEYAASLVAPTGPRTAAAGLYVDAGHGLTLALRDGDAVPWSEGPPPEPWLRVDVTDAAMTCTHGCGPQAVDIEEAHTATLGRHTVLLSPQSGTLRVLVHDPARGQGQPPVAWFAPDPRWWLVAKLQATPEAPAEPLATTRGLTKPMRPVGQLHLRLPDGGDATLTAYDAGEGHVLIPFTDPTNGESTYTVGRYLDAELVDGQATLDFNRATNPWCAYSEHYNCPVPPAGNALGMAVQAGEKVPPGSHGT